MSIHVLTAAALTISTTDVSAYAKNISLAYAAELQDDTTMGDTTRSRIGGLKDWSVTADLLQNPGTIDALIFPLVGTTFTVVVKAFASAVDVNNPSYTGTGILENYPPVTGGVGDLHMASITIQSAGTLTRATS